MAGKGCSALALGTGGVFSSAEEAGGEQARGQGRIPDSCQAQLCLDAAGAGLGPRPAQA